MIRQRALFNVARLIDDSAKDIPVEVSFAEDLKRCITKLNQPSGKPSKTYKPSSLTCIRNMYYQMTGADLDESSISPDAVGVCESGTDRHVRIQTCIESMKNFDIDCEYVDVETYIKENNLTDLEVISKQGKETKVQHKLYNLRFLTDGIIKYKGEYYILEIKTESSFKWRDRTGVAEEHLLQAYAYSLCFKIPKVLFVYENRDICSKKVYLLNVTDTDTKSVADKITTCNSYVENHIPPAKPVDVPKKSCQYCTYRTVCKKDK